MVEIDAAEREKILNNVFSSLNPLKLKVYSAKMKKKIVSLDEIIKLIEKEKKYTEKEINEILKDVYADFVTLRRDLIELKYLNRTNDGKEYWRE